jgi:hypothetical protein
VSIVAPEKLLQNSAIKHKETLSEAVTAVALDAWESIE